MADVNVQATRCARPRSDSDGRENEAGRSAAVEDQELGAVDAAEHAGIAPVASRQRELGEQFGDTVIEHRTVVAAGLVAEGTSRASSIIDKLLHAIARDLGYRIEQLDILAGGYTPQHAQDTFQRQLEIQAAAIEVLSRNKPLLVKNVD